MMDATSLTIGLFVINVLLGIAGWSMKTMITDLKAAVVELRADSSHIKEKYFKREDFTEFKQELWQRLDRIEQDLKTK